ncbi:MAG: flagellar basal body FlgE domain-containing protein [Syntrophotaleaceae bacterium]
MTANMTRFDQPGCQLGHHWRRVFDVTLPATYNYASSTTVYDSLGNTHAEHLLHQDRSQRLGVQRRR